jgi:transglutaminase superfamily protein
MVTDARVRDHPFFQTSWIVTNLLLVGSLLFLLYALCWEYSTRRYLTGFSDAVVPAAASPEEKVQTILDWMAAGPGRRTETPNGMFYLRDPLETLNYRKLLQVCGSATNAFVNLAGTSGLKVRRLLLLNAQGGANHVDAEVLLEGNWVVVDPAFRRILRDSQGAPLTSEQLRDASVLKAATQGLKRYSPAYSFERTAHLRLARVPFLGPLAGKIGDSLLPGWEASEFATLFVERESFAALVCSAVLSVFWLLMRVLLGWYAGRLGVQRVHLVERMRRGSLAFLKQGS